MRIVFLCVCVLIVGRCIVSAYALPMFREGRPTSTRKQEERVRKDPIKSHRPDLPMYGPGESIALWLSVYLPLSV